jgi:hypothetical protein
MALPFALRSRLRLRDEPVRAHTQRLPGYAVPVASYWAIMGLLTYGVASGALRPERLAALRLLPQGTFSSSRLVEPAAPRPELEEQRAPAPAIASPPTVTSATPPEQTSAPPLAVETAPAAAALEPRAPEPKAPEPPPHRVATARPLAGFSLGGRSPDGDDGYREPSSRMFADVEDDPRDRGSALPQPAEFQPAPRAAIALHLPKRRPEEARPLRANPDDPYPGFRDDVDERPAPPRVSPGDRPSPPVEREPVRPPPPAPASVSSCEAVLATANEVMDMTAARGAPDITRGAYASTLERGGYLAPCGVPDSMALEVCAAVRDGRAVGITVVTRPSDGRVRACVRNAVAALPFPKSPRLDVTRTRFDARGR